METHILVVLFPEKTLPTVSDLSAGLIGVGFIVPLSFLYMVHIYDLGTTPRVYVLYYKVSVKMRKMDFVLLFGLFCLKWGTYHSTVSTCLPASAHLPQPYSGLAPGTLSLQQPGARNPVLAAACGPEPCPCSSLGPRTLSLQWLGARNPGWG